MARSFGSARVVWNDGLRLRQAAYEAGEKYPSDAALSKLLITEAKKTSERAWLVDASAVVLQQSLADLSTAYRRFFDWVKAAKAARAEGRKPPRRVGSPRFKKRKAAQSIRFTANSRFKLLDDGKLRLLKIGDLEVRWSRNLPSAPSSVTLILDAAGRYFASFVVQTGDDEPRPVVDSEIGIDLGLTYFAVMSDGTRIVAPKFLRRAAKKIRRRAREFLPQAERLQQWLSRGRLAKSVNDASWGAFVSMLQYKAARYRRTFGKVDRWFSSTRMCHVCVRVGDKLDLSVRAWTCPCGAVHDRDLNAALNILAAGRADSDDRGARVGPAGPAVGVEAVTRRELTPARG